MSQNCIEIVLLMSKQVICIGGENEEAFQGPIGLSNKGNTCYANAVLQCLTQIECVSSVFKINQRNDVTTVFKSLMKTSQYAESGSFLDPSSLRLAIAKNHSEFEDAKIQQVSEQESR